MAHEEIVVLNQNYCDEDLVDLERDISESLDAGFNPALRSIPLDEHGMSSGVWRVLITWEGDTDEE